MPVYRIDLAYDGAGFHGYARQPGMRTVQGELEQALARRLGPVETAVAGRTDAGVHAAGQVVSFNVDRPDLDADELRRSLNRQLGPEIAVRRVAPAPAGFDARFSATSRTYHYDVLTGPVPDPFLRYTSWHVPTRLDVAAMNAAAAGCVGEHDFASFCRRGRPTVRTVTAAGWAAVDADLLRFTVTATSFCHQMVRSLAAFCVEAGRGRVDPASVGAVLAARDRNAARGAAPPHGLTLVRVGY